jgi:hypothetical protein
LEYKFYIMAKLDPTILLLAIAAVGGGYWYFKLGGKDQLAGMGGNPAAAADPEADVDPAPDAEEKDATPEPEEDDAEEKWEDNSGNIYIIKVDGWMWVNRKRMYPPDHKMWAQYYRMKKNRWRRRWCRGKYRNSRWCKDKHKFCIKMWGRTLWCTNFKRGTPIIINYPSYSPPRGGGPPSRGKPPSPPRSPPKGDTKNCPPFITKNGKKYRYTTDPMPDVMPAIFPAPYVKQGRCVYKLDNNQGRGDDGRGGWDGSKGGSGSGGRGKGSWYAATVGTSFYTYERIGNVM